MPARVLVIDDDDSVRALLRTLLELHGYEVDAAASGAAGMERMSAASYDAILLDVLMPEVNGIDILQYLRVWRPSWLHRTIVISGLAASTLNRIPDRAELGGVVQKPFEAGEIAELVREVIARSAMEEDRPPSS